MQNKSLFNILNMNQNHWQCIGCYGPQTEQK